MSGTRPGSEWTRFASLSLNLCPWCISVRFKSRTRCLDCREFHHQQSAAGQHRPFWCHTVYWPRSRFAVRNASVIRPQLFTVCFVLILTFCTCPKVYGSICRKGGERAQKLVMTSSVVCLFLTHCSAEILWGSTAASSWRFALVPVSTRVYARLPAFSSQPANPAIFPHPTAVSLFPASHPHQSCLFLDSLKTLLASGRYTHFCFHFKICFVNVCVCVHPCMYGCMYMCGGQSLKLRGFLPHFPSCMLVESGSPLEPPVSLAGLD